MKKIIIQFVLIICVVIESLLILKISTTTNIIYEELYTGLCIVVLLAMIGLIQNLTNYTYGNQEKN